MIEIKWYYFRASRERQRRQQTEDIDSNQTTSAEPTPPQTRNPEINELRGFLQEVCILSIPILLLSYIDVCIFIPRLHTVFDMEFLVYFIFFVEKETKRPLGNGTDVQLIIA